MTATMLATGPVGAAEASELVRAKECSWSCLYADGPVCVCSCDGAFHGDRMHHSPRKKPRTWKHPDHAYWPPRDADGVIIGDVWWGWFCRACCAEERERKARGRARIGRLVTV